MWHQYISKLNFKNANSLISAEVKFWSWYCSTDIILYQRRFSWKNLAVRRPTLVDHISRLTALLTGCYLLHFILHEPKVGSQSLAKHVIRKLGLKPRTFGSWVETMAYWLRCWIPNPEVPDSKSTFHHSEMDEMSTRCSWGLIGKK